MNPIPPLKSLKSLVPRGGVEPPTHGFSEVALRANIKDLADGGWQKVPAASRSGPVSHQSQLFPPDTKFFRGNGANGKHYWLTPPDVYAALDAEFSFDFDPCPHPLPAGFDGLRCEWGSSNYVNPPFGSIIHHGKKKGPTAWVRKALAEREKGRLVVLVYPVDKWVLMLLAALGSEVRNLGDVRWLSIEDGKPGHGTGRHIAAFVLRP